jgi:hypothetical protein
MLLLGLNQPTKCNPIPQKEKSMAVEIEKKEDLKSMKSSGEAIVKKLF